MLSATRMLAETIFARCFDLERKRAERSGRSFLLMRVDSTKLMEGDAKARALERMIRALGRTIRETDIRGWYAESVIGVIFTEIGATDGAAAARILSSKVTAALSRVLTIEDIGKISLSFHIYPEDWDGSCPADQETSRLRPAAMRQKEERGAAYALRSPMGFSGSTGGGVRNAATKAGRK